MGSEVPIPTQDETVTLGYARADYCYEWAKQRHEDSVKWQPFRDLVTLNGYDFAHIYDFETKKRFRDHNGEIPPLIGGTGNWVMYDPSGAKPAYRAATSEGCAEAAKADGNFRTDIQAPSQMQMHQILRLKMSIQTAVASLPHLANAKIAEVDP